MPRIVSGALAGIVATTAMTMAMRRLHGMLSSERHYPLPPREIVDQLRLGVDEHKARKTTIAAHFGYGAVAGALFGFVGARRSSSGLFYGVGIWAFSYLGWIPAARILAPAWRHAAERNLLMIAVHLVWGATLSASLRELEAAETTIFARDSDSATPFLEWREKGILK